MINWIVKKKEIITIITVAITLATAITGLVHAISEPSASKAYIILKEGVDLNAKNAAQNHDDLIRVMTWIEDLRKVDELNKEDIKSCMCSQPVPPPEPPTVTSKPKKLYSLKPITPKASPSDKAPKLKKLERPALPDKL
jgi:hypothetical protein